MDFPEQTLYTSPDLPFLPIKTNAFATSLTSRMSLLVMRLPIFILLLFFNCEIIDSLNDRNNGADNCDDAGRDNCGTTFGNYENYEADFLGVDGSVAFNLLKNDLTIASNRNEATKVAYIVAFNNPVNISENTVNFKIAVSTTESVSVDSDSVGQQVQAKKMGANPFGVKFQTKTRRARGAWR